MSRATTTNLHDLSEETIAKYLSRKPNFVKRWFKDNATNDLIDECIKLKEQNEYLNKPRASVTHEMFNNIIQGHRENDFAEFEPRSSNRLFESEWERTFLRTDPRHFKRAQCRRCFSQNLDQRFHFDEFRSREFVSSSRTQRLPISRLQIVRRHGRINFGTIFASRRSTNRYSVRQRHRRTRRSHKTIHQHSWCIRCKIFIFLKSNVKRRQTDEKVVAFFARSTLFEHRIKRQKERKTLRLDVFFVQIELRLVVRSIFGRREVRISLRNELSCDSSLRIIFSKKSFESKRKKRKITNSCCSVQFVRSIVFIEQCNNHLC